MPQINPYFLLDHDGRCSGVWSDAILAELDRARPTARFDVLAESVGEVVYNKDGRITISAELPLGKPLSMKLSNYGLLNSAISIS